MLRAILSIHLLSLVVFTLFRVMLLLSNTEQWDASDYLLYQAMLMGARFDMVINGYIMALPSLLWACTYCMAKNSLTLNKIIYYYCATLFTIAYTISTFNIPYFNQFFSHLDKSAFQWVDKPMFILGMVVKDFRLWGYVLPFLSVLFVFHYFLKRIFKYINRLKFTHQQKEIKIGGAILILGLTFLGMRGRIEKKSPIRVGTAFFSNNAFINKLGLNPNFTLINSLLKKDFHWQPLMPLAQAFSFVKKDLKLPSDSVSLLKKISSNTKNIRKPNIILVLMESMQADNMAYFGNTKQLTPILDSLAHKGLFFENAYSAGIHTFNGVFSTLFSYPALWDEHPMKDNMREYTPSSLTALAKNGYQTAYFTTHDGQFDNIEGFLHENHIGRVYSQKNYPEKEVKSTLGVPDDYMFSFSIKEMDAMYAKGKPFFCALMTASNHSPIIIPEYFQSSMKEEKLKVIQYSDWAIGKFIKDSSQKPWFNNTIFVFVADHGTSNDKTYDMSLSYNHIPIIFYAPYLLKPEINPHFMQQIDIMPSLLGFAGISYTKNNMGINVWENHRQYAYFSADDKIGVVDNTYFYIYHKDGREELYKYRQKEKINMANQLPKTVKAMKTYVFSHMEMAYHITHQKN